jgi:HSP20 family protein
MSLLRWQPWQEIDAIQRQLDQAFDELAHDAVFKSVNSVIRVPAIELTSTENAVVLKAELPGIDAEDLNIEVTRDAVSLKGEYRQETKDEHHQVYRTELRYGSFHRIIPLPVEVNNTAATAEFKQGVLTLTLPKLQEIKPQAVKVSIGEASTTPALATGNAVVEPVVEPVAEPVAETVASKPDEVIEDAWQ